MLTDGQSVDTQVRQLTNPVCKKVFREVATGARAELCEMLVQPEAGDVLMVTRLDRLARSTRDLLNTLAAGFVIVGEGSDYVDEG